MGRLIVFEKGTAIDHGQIGIRDDYGSAEIDGEIVNTGFQYLGKAVEQFGINFSEEHRTGRQAVR